MRNRPRSTGSQLHNGQPCDTGVGYALLRVFGGCVGVAGAMLTRMAFLSGLMVLLCLPLAPAAFSAEYAGLQLAAQARSLDEAVRQIRGNHKGRVLSALPERRNGKPGFRIRMLSPDGRVRTYWVESAGGRRRG